MKRVRTRNATTENNNQRDNNNFEHQDYINQIPDDMLKMILTARKRDLKLLSYSLVFLIHDFF